MTAVRADFGEEASRPPVLIGPKRRVQGFLAISMVFCGSHAFGQATPDPKARIDAAPISDAEFNLPPDAKTAEEIRELLAALGAPEYSERQKATERLKEIGVSSFPAIRDLYRSTDDLEIRIRIEEVVHHAFLDFHVYAGHPYMGVQLQPFDSSRNQKLVLPEGTQAVILFRVIENTPAQRAGLVDGDVIIAQDGVPVRGARDEITRNFSSAIQQRTPGARMMVTVVREDGTHEIEVILGRLPVDTPQPSRFIGLNEKVDRAKQLFAPWWNKHFRKEP